MADHPHNPCRTGCSGPDCHQGRLPCPHRPEDVAAMREMGVDLRPIPKRQTSKETPKTAPETDRAVYVLLAGAVAILAVLALIHLIANRAGA